LSEKNKVHTVSVVNHKISSTVTQ